MLRQLFDQQSCTYSYLLVDNSSRSAVLIDPVREQVQRDLAVIQELGANLVWILETHLHADHVTGAALLQEKTAAQTGVGSRSGIACASRHLLDGEILEFGSETIRVLETPGHTAGCLSFVWQDRVFTGDALMIDACGRTDFQEGDAGQLYESLHSKLLTLPSETLIYPAHDYEGRQVSSIGEQRQRNPYLQNLDKDFFITMMDELELPPPKNIQIAVPANKHCGKPDET